jgi:hypothetical protein
MLNLEYVHSTIRSTKTKEPSYSILDFIRVIGDYKGGGERNIFQRLCANYPEVVTICHDIQFDGRGQKRTPSTNRKGLLLILGLLPGCIGRRYRETAAELMRLWLDEPGKLAVLAKNRSEIRIDGVTVRKQLMKILADSKYPVNRAILTNLEYGAVTGRTAKQIRKDRGLTKKHQQTRDYLDDELLGKIKVAESALIEAIPKAKTSSDIYQAARLAGVQANKTDTI